MKINFILLSLCLSLQGCSPAGEVMSAEFSSMDSCLSTIKRKTNSSLNVVTDEPGNISGMLSNGQHFACQTKSSGTQGTYVEGWYTIKE